MARRLLWAGGVHLRFAITACLLACATPLAGAETTSDAALPARLSLPEAEEIFLHRGFDLLIAEYGARGAHGDLLAASAHPNPGLQLSPVFTPALRHDVLYPIGGNSPVPLWGFSVSLNDNGALEDQLSGKRSLRIEAASKAVAASSWSIENVKRVELAQLQEAYVAEVMAKLNVDAAQSSFETYDQQLKLNEIKHAHGAINGLDLSRVRQAELEALQTVDQARAGFQQAMAPLLFLLGVRGATPAITLTTGIDYSALPPLQGASVTSLDQLALQNRTDMKVAQAKLDGALVAVSQAKRSRFPDISIGAGYSEQCNAESCSSAPGFMLTLQGNLPVLYQQQGEIERAETNAVSAKLAVDKTKAQALADVQQAFAAFTAATSQVERMRTGLLDAAKRSRDLAQVMYSQGAASLLDFLDAQRAYLATELELNQELAAYWNAVFQLEQATGTSFSPEIEGTKP